MAVARRGQRGAVSGREAKEKGMKRRQAWLAAIAAIAAAGLAWPAVGALAPRRHDPRTTAKVLSQGLLVEGAGALSIEYKALHFNEEMFTRAKQTPRFLGFLNQNVWGKLGQAKLGFDLVAGGKELPDGDYDFGINMTPDDQFSVVFWQGSSRTEIPLATEKGDKPVGYLTVALMATDAVDTFTLEARCGPFRGTAEVKVPYLDAKHDHEDGKAKKDG
jgi:hypothetical protein